MIDVVRDARSGKTFLDRMGAIAESLQRAIPFTSLSALMVQPETLVTPPAAHMFNTGIGPEAMKDYPTHFVTVDPCRAYCLGRGLGRATILSRFLPDRRFGAEEFSTDLLLPANVRYILGGALGMPDGWFLLYSVQRAPGCEDFSEEELRLLNLLYPDIARSAYSTLMTEALDRSAGGAAGAPSQGVVLFDTHGALVLADPPARTLLAAVEVEGCQVADLLLQGVAQVCGPGARPWRHSSLLPLRESGWLRATYVRPDPTGGVVVLLDRVEAHDRAHAEDVASCAGLTQREFQVALHAARGLRSAEVAARLGIATSTVKVHLGRALAKLGADGRAELAALFHGHGAGGRLPPSDV